MKTFTLVLITILSATAAQAWQGRITDVGTNVGATVVKIAVPEFLPAAADAKTLALTDIFNKVLWDDLDFSGGVSLVGRSLYPLGKFSAPEDIKLEAWTTPAVDAQFLAFGSARVASGKISVEARLWDLKSPQNREAIAKRYGNEDSEDGARQIAHLFADDILELIGGGVKGISQTKIAYVGERTVGVKELYVMDYDGNGAGAMTAYKSQIMSPSWSPAGDKIAFSSFRRGSSDIDILGRVDRRPYTFDRAGGTTMTPSWAPDGSKIAFATSRDGSYTQIYVADWNGKNMRRLTVSKSVDTSPVWNPRTGREIAFISGRGGSPEIYIMDAEGTNVRRLIEEGGHMDEPAWSPDAQRIAFAWQRSRIANFDIYIYDFATGKYTQITHDAANNERPTWAPDGRHLAFESTRMGSSQIFSMLLDGTKVRQLTNTGKNTAPAWSGYIKP